MLVIDHILAEARAKRRAQIPTHKHGRRASMQAGHFARPAGWRCRSDVVPNDRRHLGNEFRRQTQRRLVEKQQFRPRNQGPADRQHLLLAARQAAGQLPAPFSHPREKAQKPYPARPEPRPLWTGHARRPTSSRIQSYRKHSTAFRTMRNSATHDRAGACTRDVVAGELDAPALGCSRPEMARKVVVLPAPLAPIRLTNCPCRPTTTLHAELRHFHTPR